MEAQRLVLFFMGIQEISSGTWMQLPRGRLSVAVVLFQVTTQHGIAMIVLTSGEKEKKVDFKNYYHIVVLFTKPVIPKFIYYKGVDQHLGFILQ